MRIGSSNRETRAPDEVCYDTALDATIEAQWAPAIKPGNSCDPFGCGVQEIHYGPIRDGPFAN
jgi:hypothetical protein